MGRYSAKRDLDLSNRTRWYVLVSRINSAIYRYTTEHEFVLVERFSNPEAGLSEHALVSDRSGRGISSAGAGTIHHALDQGHRRHEEAAKTLCEQVARSLATARDNGRFGELVIVAEPHTLGLFRKALSPNLRALVQREIHHEYTEAREKEVLDRIRHEMESLKKGA